MSRLFPRYEASRPQDEATPRSNGRATPYQARTDLYPAYSIIEDKAKKLSADATAEFNKAKTGKLELYSGKYYAACTFGGMLACVSLYAQVFLDRNRIR